MFHLTIETDNAAFADDGPAEVARILREAAAAVEGRADLDEISGGLRDANGNRVGEWKASDAPTLPRPDWTCAPSELTDILPLGGNGQYLAVVAFARDYGDDAEVIHGPGAIATAEDLARQLAKELQGACDDGMAGQFQVVAITGAH